MEGGIGWFMRKKECVALLLAGGQGSRLGVLTKRLPKPALPFGGKYRIIDFTLSNCQNSEVDVVGVLTQYKPLALNSYIGTGSAWGLDRRGGGAFILPPFVRNGGGQWYRGTADAVYQNLNFVNSFLPEYVLILSGDHIYKMDYSLLLDYHRQQKADVTIAAIKVPWTEASRFGIMNVTEDSRIGEFEEKPRQPRSNLASMGIYVFTWRTLEKYLLRDSQEAASSHDFGKDLLPRMLAENRRLYAYPFTGYWKDIGTVDSFWQANMDLLKDNPEFDLYDEEWPLYSGHSLHPPHYIAPAAKVAASIISEGCNVFGTVENSVLFPGVTVAKSACVKNSIVMPRTDIGSEVDIQHAVIGANCIFKQGCRIGQADMTAGITLTGSHMFFPRATVFNQQ